MTTSTASQSGPAIRVTIQVWVTKYALSRGVVAKVGHPFDDRGTIEIPDEHGYGWDVRPGQYATSKAEALSLVLRMAEDRIGSLEKQIVRVRAIADAARAGRLPMAKGEEATHAD